MPLKQKLNLAVGEILRRVSPNLVERIRDTQDLKRGRARGFDLDWKLCDNSVCRYAASGIQVGSKLLVIGGFTYGLEVLDKIEIFCMEKERWGGTIDLPDDGAETHHAISAEGDSIYLISGQKGRALSPSTRVSYSLNLSSGEWTRLPDLPEGRYAGAAVIRNGRLHFVGGGDEGRQHSKSDHWSISVCDGEAKENGWKEEAAVPVPAVHRGQVLLNDSWYLIGGQDEETPPTPGDPTYSYVPAIEVAQNRVLRYNFRDKVWSELAPLPVATSHLDASCLVIEDEIYVIGGQLGQEGLPAHQLPVSDEIFRYNSKEDSWSTCGHLPFRIKLMICGYYEGQLFFATGQKDTSVDIPFAERFIGSVWCAKFPGNQPPLKRGNNL